MEQQKPAEQKGSGYKIDNILLAESSFTRKPEIFFEETPFDNQINIDKESHDVAGDENKFVVGVTLTFIALQNQETAFEIKVKMVGLFEKQGETQLPLDVFKNLNAPAIIYPFIREHVSSLALKAGIGNVLLPSVNFKI